MSRYASNKELQQKQREKLSIILFSPIMLLLGIVPLITRLKITQPPTEEVARTFKIQMATDFFSYYKATFIMIIVVAMLLLVFLTINKEDIKKYKTMLVSVGSVAVFLFFTLLSTLFSPYKTEALWGVPGRMEGLLVIVCYVIMMLYTIYAFNNFKNIRYIILALTVLVAVLTVLGIFEYMGKNILLNTEFGKNLLVPAEYAQYRDSLGVVYDKGKVYGTLFHYNYMGSFGALMVPLFATLALCIKGIKEKIYLGVLTVASLFLLFGSTSRGGLIGVVIATLIGIILFSKMILKSYKITLSIIIVLGLIVMSFNALTGGTIFERIPSLVKDTIVGFSAKGKDINYLDNTPIRDIQVQDGKATIVTQTDALTMAPEGKGIKLYDLEGKEVTYIESALDITIQDPRFEGIALKKILDDKNNWGGMILSMNGLETVVFKMDTAEGIYLIDSFTQEKVELAHPPTFGFKGKEKLGSSRGYIWSRSIPMLKNTWFIGHGPDTYAFDFPQNDYIGKYYAYDTPNMIVDKPHNLYLQIGINQGIIALIAFLVLVIGYIVDSIRLYALKATYPNKEIIGIAIMLSIIGYLGAGLFNDSVVSVAPVFWILLGTGLAINHLNNQPVS